MNNGLPTTARESKRQLSRRTLISAASLAIAGCGRDDGYFGRTVPPQRQRLVYLLDAEPATLDPTLAGDLWDAPVIHALFEGLTSSDSTTGEPIAALATHYEVSSDEREYTFHLRGHPNPSGIALRSARRSLGPARWTDGAPITAHDFVYSWRRAVNPGTAAPSAYLFQYILAAEAIIAGTRSPDELGVAAIDDFSLHIRLETPLPFLLRLLAMRFFFATPRHSIEAARRRGSEGTWTSQSDIVTSGPFSFREHRPHESILVTRSAVYDAGPVPLEEIQFLIVTDGPTSVNLYRANQADFSLPMSPPVLRGLRRKKDLHTYKSCGGYFPAMNTTKPPFNDVRVRYAMNMALDKHAIAGFLGEGRSPLTGVVPPMRNYQSPTSLPCAIDGLSFDVLSFDPRAARALLAKAGHANNLTFDYLFPSISEFALVAQILQQQWRDNLGITVNLIQQEVQTWGQAVYDVAYSGIAAWAEVSGLEDPTWFLDIFKSPNGSGSGWRDPRYLDLLAAAKTTLDPVERMRLLAVCERFLLESMPCLPLYSDAWTYLCKPYVKGISGDPLHGRVFNDAWIDTNWRPQ